MSDPDVSVGMTFRVEDMYTCRRDFAYIEVWKLAQFSSYRLLACDDYVLPEKDHFIVLFESVPNHDRIATRSPSSDPRSQ